MLNTTCLRWSNGTYWSNVENIVAIGFLDIITRFERSTFAGKNSTEVLKHKEQLEMGINYLPILVRFL